MVHTLSAEVQFNSDYIEVSLQLKLLLSVLYFVFIMIGADDIKLPHDSTKFQTRIVFAKQYVFSK